MKSRVLRAFRVTLLLKKGVANPWFICPCKYQGLVETLTVLRYNNERIYELLPIKSDKYKWSFM